MQILQMIITAVTTPNQSLINIISFPMQLLEVTLTMLLFTTIINIKSNNTKKLIYVLVFSFVSFLSQIFVPSPFNTFINVISCPILVYFIFKTTILKSILAEIVPYIIFVVILIIIQNIFFVIFHGSNIDLYEIPIYRISISLISYLFTFFIYIFAKKRNFSIEIDDILKGRTNFILLFNLIIGIVAIATQSFISAFYGDKQPFEINIFSILVVLIYFVINIYSLIRTNKLEITTQTLEEEKLYNKTLTKLNENIREFKHDFNNIVQSIGGYISTNNMAGLKEYYAGLVEDCQRVNNLHVLNMDVINDHAIYTLLTAKHDYATEELGITFNLDVFLDLSKVNMNVYELSRIIGILVDNAIEAASKCEPEKFVNVSIRKDPQVNRCLFIIENTYINKDVDTEQIFEKGYTSKEDNSSGNHGLGLHKVRKVLKSSNNLNLHTTKDGKFFRQQLEIYY